jgi:hypothetical protein
LRCPACSLTYAGGFRTPRLARLAPEHQRLAEQVILAAGNLKEIAAELEVSYPTLRKRLDVLIDALSALRAADQAQIDAWLKAVEGGTMTAEHAARLIRETGGGT